MKISTMPGRFLYRALVRENPLGRPSSRGFVLTTKYYDSREEACLDYLVGDDILWPVDEIDRGVIYIPTPEEFDED
jgi:hypothetical protein